MQTARKVSALAVPMTLVACLVMGSNCAAGSFIVHSAFGRCSAATPLGFIEVVDSFQFGKAYPILAQLPTNDGMVASYLVSALLEESVSLSGVFLADAESFAGAFAVVDFEVDAPGAYRLVGTGDNAGGAKFLAQLMVDDTVIAEIGADVDQRGPIEAAQDVMLLPGQTYLVVYSAFLARPSSFDPAILDILLTPVPEPDGVTLFVVGASTILLMAGSTRRRYGHSRASPFALCRDRHARPAGTK